MYPEELKALPRWVCVRADSKIPFRADGHGAASTSDPLSWASWSAASTARELCGYDGLGFVLGCGIVGIDIDNGYNADGTLTDAAMELLLRADTYCERSRSGRGFHILVRGTLPFMGRNNRAGAEAYAGGRYFIMTGDTVVGQPVREDQPFLDWVVQTYFACDPQSDTPRGDKVYAPKWDLPSPHRIPTRPTYPPIGQGSRNVSLLSLGGALLTGGMSKGILLRELETANARACDPPLTRSEVAAVARSVCKYQKDR